MDLSLFDYYLPKELIAQEPIEPRDYSRLMILERKTQSINHAFFYQLPNFLTQQDVLVFNNSKVVPARLKGRKKDTQGKAELLLIKPASGVAFDLTVWPSQWQAMGQPALKEGQVILFQNNLAAKVLAKEGYELMVEFNKEGEELKNDIFNQGEMPLPPYLKNPTPKISDKYQTVYAKKEGSVAAPTAGFHFTPQLLNQLRKKGVQFEEITLHVGLGTFLPVKEQQVETHKMHSEYFEISPAVGQSLNEAKKLGKRIISVGTTVARVLESCAVEKNVIKAQNGWTNLYIYPGFEFKFIDALITNFHLPKSTLLMLVSAFAGREFILRAYQEAIEQKYRFFSFGDGMLII